MSKVKPELWQKKPVEVYAFKFVDWTSAIHIMAWADGIYFVPKGYEHALRKTNEEDRGNGHILDDAPAFLVVKTLEGFMRADIGDWIIRGVQGEFYPCKPDIFIETYVKVDESNHEIVQS